MDVGVIGVGVMGRNHVRVYSELKSVDRLFVTDVNEKAASQVAAANGAEVATTVEALLPQVDAVSICVPTQFHFGVATKVLLSGVNTFIEKPLCGTAREAEELVRVIPPDLTVGVGHIERFNPIVDEIRRMIRKPIYIEASYSGSPPAGLRARKGQGFLPGCGASFRGSAVPAGTPAGYGSDARLYL